MCGFSQPYDLSSGYTYNNPDESETFDLAVNYGQWLGRVWYEIKNGPVPNGGWMRSASGDEEI
jgi:hypothetical protein